MKLILASNSPRRKQLLSALVRDIVVEPSAFKEEGAALPARETALAFACGKAEEVFAHRVLGKPRDKADAERMLRALSGKMHTVYTGVCLLTPTLRLTDAVETRVYFRPLEEELIGAYVESGLPLDKAGAYGIQDGYPLVERYEGSFTNVVGLPMERVTALLREAALI